MEAAFWQERWQSRNIGFHREQAHHFLVSHFADLPLTTAYSPRIFVPLCGKTKDIAWLAAQGCHVVGVELVETAVQELFEEMGVRAKCRELGVSGLKCYSSTGVDTQIDIFVGDFFALTAPLLGAIDAIYDRAALVALPHAMRERYAAHLQAITGKAQQLLITFLYDQSLFDGPPFSISKAEIQAHYGQAYGIEAVDSVVVEGNLAERVGSAETPLEQVWLLRPGAEQ